MLGDPNNHYYQKNVRRNLTKLVTNCWWPGLYILQFAFRAVFCMPIKSYIRICIDFRAVSYVPIKFYIRRIYYWFAVLLL